MSRGNASRSLLRAALCLGAVGASQAGLATDLAHLMPAGTWTLSYDRQAQLRGLGYNKSENGSTRLCIGKDPRASIVAWLDEKKCSIDDDNLFGKTWRLQGACRVKWSKQAVPIEVEIRLDDAKHFTLDMRTPREALLDYREHGEARHIARACGAATASAGQGQENR